MSNEHHHISSLVTDLVEMAQATKRLPELERELREAYQRIDQLVSRSQELERKIESEVAINTDLAAKLHAAEVARDDAGFRQLEAEDKANALRDALTGALSGFGNTLAAVIGDGKDNVVRMSGVDRIELDEYRMAKDRAAAKQAEEVQRAAEEAARPVVEPVPTVDPFSGQGGGSSEPLGQRAPDPTGSSLEATPLPLAEPSASPSPVSYGGVSVPSDPTVSQPTSPLETALGSTAPEQAGAPIGKYANRRYADWPYYVSEAGWIEGGGTHESYWEGRAAWSPKTA